MKTEQYGVEKILSKGSLEPQAVRFHVPRSGGGWDQVTWGEVLGRAAGITRYLHQLGIGPGDKVSVFATTRVEWGYCCPAIEACRAVFVPVYFSNTPAQVSYVVNHSDARVMFTELALLPKVLEQWQDFDQLEKLVIWDLQQPQQLGSVVQQTRQAAVEGSGASRLDLDAVASRCVGLSEVLAQGGELARQHPRRFEELVAVRQDDDVAAIIYTSGTTGMPKGVVLTNRNLKASADSWHEVLRHAFPPVGQRRDILWLPVSHMSGWGILGQGTTNEYETWLSDPYHLLEIIPEVKPTMLLSVPAYWEKMYSAALNASPDPQQQYARLREITGGELSFLLSGGAGLKREVKEFFRQAGIQMIEGYGLTECSPNLTMNRLDDFDFDSVGKPMPGVTLELAPDGEIMARGDNVFGGYYKDPEATAATFTDDGWLLTGDLGQWTDRGFLEIMGRKKEIIVTSGGKNIGPATIEAMFVGQALIEHVVLYGNERKYLVGLLTLNELATSALAEARGIEADSHQQRVLHPVIRAEVQRIVDQVNGQLASHETIKKYHLHPGHLSVEAGQVTPSLKLRRNQVWSDFGAQFEALYE